MDNLFQQHKKSVIKLKLFTQNFIDLKLEKEFRDTYFKDSVVKQRIAVITSIILYASFGLLDKSSSPNFYSEFFIIRFLVVIPIFAIFLGITFLKSFRLFWQQLMSVIVIVAGTGIVYMLHRDPLNIYYYGGLFLIFMGSYFYVKLRFFTASLSGLLILIIYIISYYIIPQSSSSSIDNVIIASSFFLASNIICMIGLHSIEQLERIGFYQRYNLEQKQNEIESINLALEERVVNRTKDLQKAEDQVKRDLQEKNTLLLELYHRTKNNMQVISSMLLMESRRINDDSLTKSFKNITSKINTMALVHQKLYQAKDLSQLNLKEYIKDLVQLIMHGYFKETDKITVHYDMDDIYVLIDTVMPLGLVLNELITNSFKHNFLKGFGSNISITMKLESDEIHLTLSDDGRGIPESMDLRKTKSMGLRTMFSLIERQLEGSVEYKIGNGLTWDIRVQDKINVKRV